MTMGVSTKIVSDLGVTETLGNHFFAESGCIASFDEIVQDPFTPTHDKGWLMSNGLQPQGMESFLSAILTCLARGVGPPRTTVPVQPPGEHVLQSFAIRQGGRRMLSSGGARSSQLKRHRIRSLIRRIRDGLGFGWLSKVLRGR